MLALEPEVQSQEKNSQGKGWIVSLILHILIIILFLLPILGIHPPPPPSPQEGLLVNLGLPDEGEGQETPKGTEAKPEPTPAPVKPVDEKPAPQPVAAKNPAPKAAPKVITGSENTAVRASEAAAQKAAQEQARQQAAEQARQQEAYNKTKKSYGDLLGTGGKGNTGKPGSQGDPNGDPNASNLEGISTGSGRVGGGLGNRGVLHEPQINDRSQKTGRVVITVCVDKTGKVVKAEYTQKGSTTTDSELKDIARKAAMQFKFTTSDIEEQCGTITVDFKIKGQ